MVVREGVWRLERFLQLRHGRCFPCGSLCSRLRTSLTKWVFLFGCLLWNIFLPLPPRRISALLLLCWPIPSPMFWVPYFPSLWDAFTHLYGTLTFLWAQVETWFRIFLLNKQLNALPEFCTYLFLSLYSLFSLFYRKLFGKMVLIYCLHFCFSTHCYMAFLQTIKIILMRVTV